MPKVEEKLTPAEAKKERVAQLRRERAAVLSLLRSGQPDTNGAKPGRGNPNIVEYGKKTQWKKGESGYPNGRPRGVLRKVGFWKKVVIFLGLTRADVEMIDESSLTLAELGARKFALAVADGKWFHMKEVIERELGRAKEGGTEDADDGPKLIKMPFAIAK